MTGVENTGIGMNALSSNTTGDYNTAVGLNTLTYNSTGNYNTASGAQALAGVLFSGTGNTATGSYSLSGNSTGNYNTATGYAALNVNSTGEYNTATGNYALYANTSGRDNIANGNTALYKNTSGIQNTAIGDSTLLASTTGNENTAVGMNAGGTITTGSNNTLIGYATDVAPACSTLTNMTALGFGAVATTANYVAIGNTTVGTIAGQVGFTTYSDGRFKINVKENVSGLTFIKKLRPVTYNLDTKSLDNFIIQNMPDSVKIRHQQGMDFVTSTGVLHSGFIAQEVEKAGSDVGFKSSIVHAPANNTDPYGVNYAEIVVPLVKAVQEQQTMIDSLITLTNALQNQINSCCNNAQQGMRTRSNSGNNTIGSDLNSIDNGLSSSTAAAILYQNTPNPFNQQTGIAYFIPTTSQSASIMVFDLQGKLVLTLPVTNYGSGSTIINGNSLTPGMFVYSLLVNGNVIDTKRMILTQ